MAEGLDWIFRPLDKGWVKYESYLDGTVHLYDVALMCDAIDVMLENRLRADRAAAARRS